MILKLFYIKFTKMSKSIIELDNIHFIVEKSEDESKEQFYARSWYISKLKPINNKDFDTAVIKSKIWSNINYLENSYNEKISNLL